MLIKVALVDDHPTLLRGLLGLLKDTSYIQVTGAYLSGEELLQDIRKNQPDVLLMDIQMPGQTGEEIAAILQRNHPLIKILAFTNSEQQYYIKSLLKYGVMGYVLKTSSEVTLLEGIKSVYEGKQYFDLLIQDQATQALKEEHQGTTKKTVLTDREREILELIAKDYKSDEIAAMLFISKRTVDFHRANLLLKLKVKHSNGLVGRAIELGLIK